ncbi:MAG: glycosyltransferase family 1 protein, partial [Candidatus Electrothrix sp. AR4]|nr:glycosyltransferase family 1 protein [Candidatus Electrothrix sp. AR4]
MRIVIDLQSAQSTFSRNRGIGRYSLSLTKTIIRNRGEHEILVALSGLFPETILPLREELDSFLPQSNIHVWHAPGRVNFIDENNNIRRKVAEYIREAFLITLNPDMVLITSIFEGYLDDVVTSIGMMPRKIPTASILYDFNPLIDPPPCFNNVDVRRWYEKKIEHLRKSDILLSTSKFSREEGIACLNSSDEFTINISMASEKHFNPLSINHEKEHLVRIRYGLKKAYVMYTGGIDYCKNIEGLIRAYSNLPITIREKNQLAIVCSIQETDHIKLSELAKNCGLEPHEVVFTGYIPEEDLITLYSLCKTFVLPLWHEGFGLLALEAMSCGKAVIGANTSSLPEVIGVKDALFDPRNDQSITDKLMQVISDDDFRSQLEIHGLEQAKKKSWDKCAMTA